MDLDGAALTVTAGRRSSATLLLAALPITFIGVLFLYPVATIVWTGLAPDGRLDLSPVLRVVSDPAILRVVWFTVWQATVSTVLTLLLGLPAAYVVARLDFPGRKLLRAAVTVPFVLPTVVVASAFLSLLGPRSPLNDLAVRIAGEGAPQLSLHHTVWAILLAHVFFNYAVVVRTVGGLWAHLDPRTEEAAQVLGAGRVRTFLEVTLPALRPAISAAAAIVFLFTFTSFGVVLILGGPRLATIEVEIHRFTAQLLDLPTASALALVQLLFVVGALVVYGRLQRRGPSRQRLRSAADVARPPRGARQRAFLAANLIVMLVLLALPLAVLVERSLATGSGYGLDLYRTLGESRRASILAVSPWEAVRNSVVFGTVATVVAVTVGGAAAWVVTRSRGVAARLLDGVLMLPLGISAVTVGFGFLISLDRPPLDLRASPLLVPLAQAVVATPFVVRILVPVLGAVDERLREAAAVMGARPRQVWREIDLPIVGRALLVAAGFAFAISVGEFGATVFIARANLPTLPIAIFRLLGQPGAVNFGQAMAMSTILMVLTATVITAIERVRVGTVGEF
ncbi:MAG: iron ABC transporter permease [Actinobacteria bacterium]|nr:iron ABC transporter permease [Actinomycetota bacterium]